MIEVYTDGSSNNNLGSYSFVVYKHGKQIVSHTVIRTEATSNRMEIMGVSHALYYCYNRFGNVPISLYTDSEYTYNGYYGKSKIKKNKEYFNLLFKLKDICTNINVIKVKAHSTNHKNNYVDKQARNKLREYIKRSI